MASVRGALFCLAALGVWNQAFVGPRPSPSSHASRVATRAIDKSGGLPSGPLVVYMDALMDAAAKKGESVGVTKDVMRYKKLREEMDPEMMFELTSLLNAPGITLLQEAGIIIENMGPWESTVFPKFVTFLAKKRRLKELMPLCEEYVAHLYARESIEPVTVFSAAPLTDEQVDKIKTKMADKLEARDIKLIQKIDANLLSGFKIEWGYTDPERPLVGAESIDLSLKRALDEASVVAGR